MEIWETLKARGLVKQHTDEAELKTALTSGQVTYYSGFDPTANSLHIGHLVPIMAMSWLQKFGHRPIAVVGGGTGLIGDPSGKTEMRQFLDEKTIQINLEAQKAQLSRFLNLEGAAGLMMNNAEWLCRLEYIPFLRDIGKHFSVNRMLSAEGYRLRMEKGLNFIELNYQIMQAYDFLELYRRYGCTLQLGGDDQWSNILAGADLIRRVEQKPAHVITQPLILTATGEKMGKSVGGAVWLDPNRFSAYDFYQFWLNVLDEDVIRFLKLFTFLPLEEIEKLSQLQGAEIRFAKQVLAKEVTSMVHGVEATEGAISATHAMISGAVSENMRSISIVREEIAQGKPIVELLVLASLSKSKGEARRLIENGGVRIGNDKVSGVDAKILEIPSEGLVLRVGKNQAVRVLNAE